MIASLKGQIDQVSGKNVIIDVSGVGYEVLCSTGCVSNLILNQEVKLITYTDVQETSIRIFGFEDFLEKQVFLLLIGVSGIGPKSAIDIVSKINKVELLGVIGREDAVSLKKIKGVGGKTADRLILELKDKVKQLIEANRIVTEVSGESPRMYLDEALEALQALGFNKQQAKQSLELIKENISEKSDTGEIVRMALSQL